MNAFRFLSTLAFLTDKDPGLVEAIELSDIDIVQQISLASEVFPILVMFSFGLLFVTIHHVLGNVHGNA